MANPPTDPNKGPSTPRWVKAFGIIGIVLVLLFIVMMLAGGNHGPGRHMPSARAPDDHTPPFNVVEVRVQQP